MPRYLASVPEDIRAAPPRERWNISRLALSHPRPTLAVWLGVVLAGALAFRVLKVALLPDIAFPVVVVNVTAPLADARAVERQVAEPLEHALGALPDIDRVSSTSFANRAVITAAFAAGPSLDEAERGVRAAVRVAPLPAGAAPAVTAVDLNESPIVTYVMLSVRRPQAAILQLAGGAVVPALEQVPGVRAVALLGDGERTRVALDGTPGVGIQVVKRAKANTLETARRVEHEVLRLQSDTPDVFFIPVADQAAYIREAARATMDALGLAVLLSVLVIFPFLGDWTATLISALAIPVSLLGTFVAMAAARFNLEMITLLALALVIGIIVDDAIVDVENIARHLEDGQAPREAALRATDEIGLTVAAATLTIVAVFLPVALMGGVVGRFFRPFGLTVSAAVLTSLLVARTLSPLLAARWLRSRQRAGERRRWESEVVERYRRLLGWALDHRGAVLLIAAASFGLGCAIIPFIPKGFVPRVDRGEFLVRMTAAPGTGLAGTGELAARLDSAARRDPDVASVYTLVGGLDGAPDQATLRVRVRPGASTAEAKARVRASTPALAGATASVEDIPFIELLAAKPLQVALTGDDLAALERGADLLRARLARRPGFADVTVSGLSRRDGVPMEISRSGGRRAVYLSANIGEGSSLGAATDALQTEARSLPGGVRLELGGDSEQAATVLASFAPAIGFAVLCIVVVLAALFRSWVEPLVIALALPLSTAGAMLGLFLARSDFGLISLLGLVFLLGLVNKNAILLVDRTRQLEVQGLDRRAALLAAGPERLRPILMTTAATVLGMLPIALGFGAGAELRAPLAVAIIGGLATSTLLSLVVVPVGYSLLHQFRARQPGQKVR